MELLGWSGSLAMCVCLFPQLREALITKKVGMNEYTLYIYLYGLVAFIIYTPTIGWSWPLMVSYIINFFCTSTLIYYKKFYK